MARDPRRDEAYEIYKKHKGDISLVALAEQLDVPQGTIRGWKAKDKWDGADAERSQREKRARREKEKEEKKAVEKVVESVMSNEELNDKQRLFCLYFIKSFNATQSYKKAYDCSYAVANTEGSKLLVNPRVGDEIEKLKKERYTRAYLEGEDIFQKMMDIAFADVGDYLDFGTEKVPVIRNGKVVKVMQNGREQILSQTINTVKFKESTEVDTSIISEVRQGKEGAVIKLYDKTKALEWLAEHIGMATDEQRARIEALKAKTHSQAVFEDDGFLEALGDKAGEVWDV